MDGNNIPFLCGGTFYILLLQALKKDRRIRVNDLDGAGARDKAINDVTCLKGLVRTFYRFNEYLSDSTFTSHKDQYKFCRTNSTEWLQFENASLINAFDESVKEDYSSMLKSMNKFIDVYLDHTDLGEHLIRALMEVIYLDTEIEEATPFYMYQGGKTISRLELLNLPKINARRFLLAVWHFIITQRGSDNIRGAETVEAWMQNAGKHSPYKFVGTVGNEYAREKEISFENVVLDPIEESVSFDADTEAETVESTVESEEDSQQQKNGEKTVNEILNVQAVFNQRAEKIVNIGHVEHLEI